MPYTGLSEYRVGGRRREAGEWKGYWHRIPNTRFPIIPTYEHPDFFRRSNEVLANKNRTEYLFLG